ncbi:MAG TPA: type II toxin-antitoxin system VapC family toxin [Bryobacteraceae bacterium]|jgi:predicted nucleic acid-binding protein
MSILVDTNVLLRSAQPSHLLHVVASEAVDLLLSQEEAVYFCPQSIAEFWHVATRPVSVYGLGFSREELLREVQAIESLLSFLPEKPEVYDEWKRIVSGYGVQGLKVFDARLVATARVYGITRILTFNGTDFKRYEDISVIDPALVS